jgi:hypothetical protein
MATLCSKKEKLLAQCKGRKSSPVSVRELKSRTTYTLPYYTFLSMYGYELMALASLMDGLTILE